MANSAICRDIKAKTLETHTYREKERGGGGAKYQQRSTYKVSDLYIDERSN